MNELDLRLTALDLRAAKMEQAIEQITQLLQTRPRDSDIPAEFLSVEDAVRLKGGAALSTYRSNRFLLPGCGNSKYAVRIAGKLCFPRAECERWKVVDDAAYLEYAQSCGVKVIPDKYMRLIDKARRNA